MCNYAHVFGPCVCLACVLTHYVLLTIRACFFLQGFTVSPCAVFYCLPWASVLGTQGGHGWVVNHGYLGFRKCTPWCLLNRQRTQWCNFQNVSLSLSNCDQRRSVPASERWYHTINWCPVEIIFLAWDPVLDPPLHQALRSPLWPLPGTHSPSFSASHDLDIFEELLRAPCSWSDVSSWARSGYIFGSWRVAPHCVHAAVCYLEDQYGVSWPVIPALTMWLRWHLLGLHCKAVSFQPCA